MSPKSILPVLLALVLLAATSATAAGDTPAVVDARQDLAVRLKVSGGLAECWNALFQINSCSKKIVPFLLNGQVNLGSQCCQAIDVVSNNCWPSMLTSLGLTAIESQVLKGYCNTAPAPAPAPGGGGSASTSAAAPAPVVY